MKEKLKSITFNVRPEMWETLQKIQANREAFDMSDTIRRCITLAKERWLENYNQVALQKLAKPKKTGTEKEMDKLEAEEARKKLKQDDFNNKKKAICDILGGTCKETAEGSNVFLCTYYKYQQENSLESSVFSEMPMTVPFEQLSNDAPEYQYYDYFGQRGAEVKERLLKLKTAK